MLSTVGVDDQSLGFHRIAGNEVIFNRTIKGGADGVFDFKNSFAGITSITEFIKPHLNLCGSNLSNRGVSKAG